MHFTTRSASASALPSHPLHHLAMATSRPGNLLVSSICQSCRLRLPPHARRQFTTSRSFAQEDLFKGLTGGRPSQSAGRNSQGNYADILDSPGDSMLSPESDDAAAQRKAHRLHIYSTKHNTHITLVQPPRSAAETSSTRSAGSKTTATEQKKMVDVLLSLSTGNLGFKKAGRGSYDAAFQLAGFALKQIKERGIMGEIRELEVVLRGFGPGREASTKALLGTEGRQIRGKISAVVDATRLKQGSPRSKSPRRLG